MPFVLDANILVRLARRDDPQFPIALRASQSLRERGRILHCIPQAIREFWVVATRPREANGIGLTPAEADEIVSAYLELFPLLPDTNRVFENWRGIVAAQAVADRDAHDAGYVAAMRAHAIPNILTFDERDFRRYSGIVVVHPDSLGEKH